MKKIFFKALLAFGAITIPLAGGAVALASCTSTSTTDLSTTAAAQYWVNFLDQNHGRWTGNISNFTDVKSDNTGLTNTTSYQVKNPLTTTVSGSKTNNFGSYHAYLWLVDTITKMGYTNHTESVSRPSEATINAANGTTSRIQAQSGTTKFTKSNRAVDSSGNVTRGERSVIYKDPNTSDAALMYKTGLVTQGFLWSGNDRANSVAETFNNVGSNLIVTINPDETKENTTDPYDFWIVSHYDSTAKTGTGQSQASWGATDNATSVAVNLALLKYFSDASNRAKLKTRLHIVFADAEEVGVLGSNALVKQFLDASADSSTNYPLLASTWGMVNMDTVAGGDFMYVHSSTAGTGNKSTAIRDALNSVSKSIANTKGDSTYELAIHKQYHYKEVLSDDYDMPEGETGDWSDHAPFYQIGKIPVAYFESTNFAQESKTEYENTGRGVFDGYSQTSNKYAWITWDHVPVEMVQTTDLNGQTIWVLPDGYTLSDFLIGGDIWHSDIDTPNWLKEYIGYNKIFKQLDACYQTLIEYLTTVTPAFNK